MSNKRDNQQPAAGSRKIRRGLVIGTFAILSICGCSDESLEFTETKQIEEKITQAELKLFRRVVRSLPDQQLMALQSVLAPPPDWNKTRTLRVKNLVTEEQEKLKESWSVDGIARQLQRKRSFQHVLRREQMTPEQFVSLALTIGAALSRNTLDDDRDLATMLSTGEAKIDELQSDDRIFASLSPGERHAVLRQAIWITRVDRAQRLSLVPPENISLVRKHLDQLERIFPIEFTSDPFVPIADLLDEQGLPFEELPDSGRDDEIVWHRSEATIGTDSPDSPNGQP